MANAPSGAFWKEPRAARAAVSMSRVYLAQDAAGHFYFDTDSAEQDATLAWKDSRLFFDTDVTDGGRIGLAGTRLVLLTIPASTI